MMNKTYIIVLLVLLALTIISAVFSLSDFTYRVEFILILALIKFLLVAFYFMELKKAHIFWKASIIIFISIIVVFISFIIKS